MWDKAKAGKVAFSLTILVVNEWRRVSWEGFWPPVVVRQVAPKIFSHPTGMLNFNWLEIDTHESEYNNRLERRKTKDHNLLKHDSASSPEHLQFSAD